jgi:short-subunit dehydrogenase
MASSAQTAGTPSINAVITGATQGIGRAVAEMLLAQGCNVAICARNGEDLTALQSEWQSRYPQATIHVRVADFSKPDEVAKFAIALRNELTSVDILVNNAGIFEPGDIATAPRGQLERTMQVNVYSAYHLTRTLLPQMQAGGHIFNMCSVASLKAYPNGGSYSISKYALLGFSDNLREELKPRGIRVTAICPGATWSRSWSSSGVDEERIMEASDVAKMLWTAYSLSAKADVETIVMRPILGDL